MKKEEQTANKLTKAATILSKLLEIAYDIGAVTMLVGFVLFLLDKSLFPGVLVKGGVVPGEAVSVHGFSIALGNPDGTINSAAMILFLLCGAMTLELMAWVFRDTYLILRTTQGLTKFSQGKTPFQKDNVRMMREIGIFFISITVVQLIFSVIAALVIGPEQVESSVGMMGLVTGLLMLCLSQVFALGMQMQNDMDGLV